MIRTHNIVDACVGTCVLTTQTVTYIELACWATMETFIDNMSMDMISYREKNVREK